MKCYKMVTVKSERLYAYACDKLGYMYFKGNGAGEDKLAAKVYYEQVCKLDDGR